MGQADKREQGRMKERTRIILLAASCLILISAIILSNLIVEIVGMLLLGYSISEYLKWKGFLFIVGSIFVIGTLFDVPIFNYTLKTSAMLNGFVVIFMIIGYAQGRQDREEN